MAVLAFKDQDTEVFDLDGICGPWTYEEYLNWDGPRLELVDGVPYLMAAPDLDHQRILVYIFDQFYHFLKGRPCEVFQAPVDVMLFPGESLFYGEGNRRRLTIFQPDILVVCDKEKTKNGKAVMGAPDLIIEILSPGSKLMDFRVKKEMYFEAGVKEYWIVDRFSKRTPLAVLVYTRSESGDFTETLYQAVTDPGGSPRMEVPVGLYSGFTIRIVQDEIL